MEDGEIRISTVDIASWLERPHYNVTREVEKMLQEYENTQQLAALTCEASEYTDPTGRKLSMFVMDIRAAVKFVTRLKGQKPTIVRDKIMDAELRWKAPKTEAPERCARVRAEKPLPGTPIRPRLLSGWKTPRPRAAPDLSRGGFSMEKAPHPAAGDDLIRPDNRERIFAAGCPAYRREALKAYPPRSSPPGTVPWSSHAFTECRTASRRTMLPASGASAARKIG